MNRRRPYTRPNDVDPESGASLSLSHSCLSRRQFLHHSLAVAALLPGLEALAWLRADSPANDQDWSKLLPPIEVEDKSRTAPALPVAIGRCQDFEVKRLAETMNSLFDKIGGLDQLMRGKTVTMKLNNTGDGRERMNGAPAERSYQVHPHLVEVLCGLFHKAGARRLYVVESFYENRRPEEIYQSQGWDITRIQSAAEHQVTFEDTKAGGVFKDYSKVAVPWGGYVFPAYHINRRYVETDVFVSVGKLKNHNCAGMTGAVKNLFGVAPIGLYGNDAPNERTTENRANILHFGSRSVPAGVTPERYRDWDKVPSDSVPFYRVPRVTADILGVRPVDLAVVEAIATCQGGEGPWSPRTRLITPGLVLVGRNAVNVDAIGTAVAGYDPLAGRAQKPWLGDNHLALLARAGIGTNDPGRIEMAGLSLKEALFEYEPGSNGWVKQHA